jgi:heterotetrameric sarcosine oxidase gamma subunit
MKLKPQATLGAPFGSASPVRGFISNSATLYERSDIGCVLLTAAVDSAAIVPSASAAAGVGLPLAPGKFEREPAPGPGRTALWLSPRSWLIHCGIEEEIKLAASVNASFPDKLVHAVPFTDHLCWFELSGASSPELLTEGTFLSLEPGGLPVGHAKRCLIAQVAAIFVHESDSVWLIAVERSRARYFADWLTAAATSTNGGATRI